MIDQTFDEVDNNIDEFVSPTTSNNNSSLRTPVKPPEKRIPQSRVHTAKFTSLSVTSDRVCSCNCAGLKAVVMKELKSMKDTMTTWKAKVQADVQMRIDVLTEHLHGQKRTMLLQEETIGMIISSIANITKMMMPIGSIKPTKAANVGDFPMNTEFLLDDIYIKDVEIAKLPRDNSLDELKYPDSSIYAGDNPGIYAFEKLVSQLDFGDRDNPVSVVHAPGSFSMMQSSSLSARHNSPQTRHDGRETDRSYSR